MNVHLNLAVGLVIIGLIVFAIFFYQGIRGQVDLDDRIKACETAGGAWLKDHDGHDCYDVRRLSYG